MRLRSGSALAGTMVVGLGLVSCSNEQGPAAVKPGTPAFFWHSAEDSYKKGNFAKVVDQLGNLTNKENDYRDRARVWLMAVSAGLARGNMEWADIMEKGGKAARTGQLEFRKQMSQSRAAANQHALRLVELSHQYTGTVKDAEIPFGYGWPPLSVEKTPEIERALKGIVLNPAETEKSRGLMEQRGVLQAMSRFTGAGGDLKKAAEVLSNGDFKLPRDKFLLTLAGELVEIAELYMPKKLDQSGRAHLFCSEAKDALGQAPPSKESKELAKRIDATVKKLPKQAS
ncbi:MAG: hypothetical protein IT161_14010 [Bryobacterales bacterium]|nr:hypothetical protein [Bryobacterales bacterium]